VDREATRKEKTYLDRKVGKNIRNEREQHKMTREELAEELGLTTAHLGMVERGERGATLVIVEKVSHFFSIPMEILFAEPDKKSMSVKEDDRNLVKNRKKIAALLTNFNEGETELLVHIMKGIINQRAARSVHRLRADDCDDE